MALRLVVSALFPNGITTSSKALLQIPQRGLWGYLNSIANRVDEDRLKEVGPDRACAEWILRCGGSVKWKDFNHWQRDYNTLPTSSFDRYKVEEIDASGSSVMSVGFPHLKNLHHVRKVILHDCGYLDNESLAFLPLVKDTLQELQISSCGDITDAGLAPLCQLSNLQKLTMFDLPELRKKESTLGLLRDCLPKCDIHYLEPKKMGPEGEGAT